VLSVRRARPADAASIGAVHVACWRSTYAGILPDAALLRQSAARQARYYEMMIRAGGGAYVAVASGPDLPPGSAGPRVVGFTTFAPISPMTRERAQADGDIHTLYVLDDWRERGLGRRLMRAAAAQLAEAGCASASVSVLSANPNRWFYERLGGKLAAEGVEWVSGRQLGLTTYTWSPLARLVEATSSAP
jgi:ribosomal protein S18 acetylase RimI-like enzyme